MNMTDRAYVIRACGVLKIDLIKPTRGNPGVVAFKADATGYLRSIVEAADWKQAREQLDAWRVKQAR